MTETDTTVTTEIVGALVPEMGALDSRESSAPALMFIGYGIAMLSAGQWMLEEGIKRAGGWKGIRQMLTRAERIIPVMDEPETAPEIPESGEDESR